MTVGRARQGADRVERAGIDAIGERIVQQEQRDLQHVRIARTLDAVALQRAEIVGVAELGPELLEDLPVALLALGAERVDQIARRSAITASLSSSVLSTSSRKNEVISPTTLENPEGSKEFRVRSPGGRQRFRPADRARWRSPNGTA